MKASLTPTLTCERTVYGYILRKTQPSMRLALLMTFIPISILAAMVFMLEPGDRLPYLLLVAACLGVQLLMLLPLLLLTKGQRLELDREGVHLRFDHRRGKTLYWSDIRDWGFGYTVSKYGKCYFLYFSPAPLQAVGTDNKKLSGVKGILMIPLGKKDYPQLSRSGALAFCRGYLGDGEGAAGRYVPLFRSDITEGLYED